MAIRVLIVDDSAFMRRAIRTMLSKHDRIEVVGAASNGQIAVDQVKALKPDVVTLDIEMPVMDGLTALRHIKRQSDARVIMCSSLTQEGSQHALQALRLGADDVVAKDHASVASNTDQIGSDLVSLIVGLGHKVQAAAISSAPKPSSKIPHFSPSQFDMVCIGSSTGGPPVLETVLLGLQPGLQCPVVVAQHMPALFTKSMAERLDEICRVPVKLLQDGEVLKPGVVYICPGGVHSHLLRAGSAPIRVRCNEEPKTELYRPSVNVLLKTASEVTQGRTLGMVLTGIGEDGMRGAIALNEAGGTVLTQSAESCVIYGMPRAVDQAGVSKASLSPAELGAVLGQVSLARAA